MQTRLPSFLRNDARAGDRPRVLLVAESASQRFGGEAILPVHYFRFLRARGVDVRLLVHERTRDELVQLFPADRDRIHFVGDTTTHLLLHRLSGHLPQRVENMLLGFPSRLVTQIAQRRLIYRLIRAFAIDIVHQSTPVSPRESSLLFNLGIPTVMGPLNGNMTFPPGFRAPGGVLETITVTAGRWFSNIVNRFLPGKRRATTLLVANVRTRSGLPGGTTGRVQTLVENGVDLTVWTTPQPQPQLHSPPAANKPVEFVYVGRLVDSKAVDVLLEAFAVLLQAMPQRNNRLHIVGDGRQRNSLIAQAKHLGIESSVIFHGWQTQAVCAERLSRADVFVLPSIYECGGAVVLEAMASGVPVIATAWGGPVDYLDESCGILVEPRDRAHFIRTFAASMQRLALDPALRRSMGQAGRVRAVTEFDWGKKIDAILEVYQEAITRYRANTASTAHLTKVIGPV